MSKINKRVAVMLADGCEEGEVLTIVDILRRAEIEADLVGLREVVSGAHEIVIKADRVLDKDLVDYDMVVLPGGYGGANNLKNCDELIGYMQEMYKNGKFVCAMCAAPIALGRAGLLKDHNWTAYPGYGEKINMGHYLEDIVVVDGNLITSRAPSTTYAFAYTLVDMLGGDSLKVKNRMVYFNAFDPEVTDVVKELPVLSDRKIDKKVAVLMAEGYEEGETITIVDLLRRLNITCETFSLKDGEYVLGMHKMLIKPDHVFSDEIKNYDMIILPGGRPGGQNLREDPRVIDMMKYFNDHHKYIGALCSGTIALETADVIQGKKVTGYTNYAEKLTSGVFVDEVAVADDNLVTSQGPATPYPFAFKVGEVLGADVKPLKLRTLYKFSGGK